MDSFEEALAETVRKYSHLYDSSTADYKDIQKTRNSWREIAESLGTEESICRKRWRGLRDRFAKAKRRMHCRTGDPNGNSIVIVPPLFISLQWLDSHVKYREMTASSIMSDPQVEVGYAIIPFVWVDGREGQRSGRSWILNYCALSLPTSHTSFECKAHLLALLFSLA